MVRLSWGSGILLENAKGQVVRVLANGTGGFSRTNLYRMRAFYLAYPETGAIVPQAVGQTGSSLPEPLPDIPWGHNVILFEKVK